jgi:hypothetical protein
MSIKSVHSEMVGSVEVDPIGGTHTAADLDGDCV